MGDGGAFDQGFDDRHFGFDVGDFAGVDFILGHATGLGGLARTRAPEPLCNWRARRAATRTLR